MGNTVKDYDIKYKKAKDLYLNGWSLSAISKELHMDRGTLSHHLKEDGIEVINKQNALKFNNKFFDIIDNEHKAYWLGFLYADSAVSSSNNTIEISLKSSDIKHLEKLIKDLEYTTDKYIFQDNIRCRLQIVDKHLKEQLIKLGCPPKKSLILKFPTEDQVPSNLLFPFIRGYIDGDGSVMIGKDHHGEYTKPRLNILGTKEFLTVLIEKTGWRSASIGQKLNNQAYDVEWGGIYVFDYLDQLYQNATIYLDRKYEKYLTLCELKNCRFKTKVLKL